MATFLIKHQKDRKKQMSFTLILVRIGTDRLAGLSDKQLNKRTKQNKYVFFLPSHPVLLATLVYTI